MKMIGFVSGEWEFKQGEDFKSYHKRTEKMLSDLLAHARSLKENELIGAVISFPVADGKAFYRIDKIKPLSCRSIPYGDAYQIPEAHMRGLNLSDVKRLVKRERAVDAIFFNR